MYVSCDSHKFKIPEELYNESSYIINIKNDCEYEDIIPIPSEYYRALSELSHDNTLDICIRRLELYYYLDVSYKTKHKLLKQTVLLLGDEDINTTIDIMIALVETDPMLHYDTRFKNVYISNKLSIELKNELSQFIRPRHLNNNKFKQLVNEYKIQDYILNGNLKMIKYIIENNRFIFTRPKHQKNNKFNRLVNQYKYRNCAILRNSNVKVINYIINKNVDDINNLFIFSLYSRHMKIISYFISIGADVTSHNNEVIKYASVIFSLKNIEYLISVGADYTADNYEAILRAINNNRIDVVKYYMSICKNIVINFNIDTIYDSIDAGLDMLKCVVLMGADITMNDNDALIYASCLGYLDIVKYLIFMGADITTYNHTRISSSTIEKHKETFDYLKSQGATIIQD